MKQRMKKSLKIIAIAVGSVLAVLLAGIAIAINFVFTPEKLTPLVVSVANDALDAELDMERVELTFFSTFPRFGVSLENGALVSRTEAQNASDTLASFSKCVAVVNPFDYLIRKHINVRKLELEDAAVYAYKAKDGKANWDIIKSGDIEEEEDTDSAPIAEGIQVDRVVLKNADVVFDDRQSGIYARMEDADLRLRALLKKERILFKIDFRNGNTLFWQNNQLLVNQVAVDLKTVLDMDMINGMATLEKTSLAVNGIRLDLNGFLKKGELDKTIDADLTYSLHAPSLETVIQMIPESIVRKEALKAKGEVLVDGKVKGLYGEGYLPETTLQIKIKDASARYKKMKYGIDDLELDFNAYVDLMRKNPSFADLKIFRFEGAHTTVLADATVEDLLAKPYVRFNTVSKIDLDALSETFPLQEGVKIGGKVDADLKLAFSLESVKKQDYGKINVNGRVDMDHLSMFDEGHAFEMSSDASFVFTGEENVDAELTIDHFRLNSPKYISSIDQMKAQVTSSNVADLSDSLRIADVMCSLEVNEWSGALVDTLDVSGSRVKAKALLRPGKDDVSLPEIKLSMSADTLLCLASGSELSMNRGGFEILSSKRKDSTWYHGGIVGFDRVEVQVDDFALPMALQKTAVTLVDQDIALKQAKVTMGDSDMEVTGTLYDLFDVIKGGGKIKGVLSIASEYIDCNQIIGAMSGSSEEEAVAVPDTAAVAVADSLVEDAAMKLFVIPESIDFRLETDLKKVVYGKETFENLKGHVDIKDQTVHLKNLSLRGLDADMKASLLYVAKEASQGYAGFDLRFSKVDVGRLVGMMTSLDSLVPMLKSLDGVVDFEVAAESKLDADMNPVIPTLKSAVYLKGDSLVLMDSETFASISKMLMFKNKKRNVVDSLALNIMVEDGNVTIPPFPLLIDRYKVAVGGKQDLDMNLDYHISVLKSPIVIKLGVNIKGNLDNIDFGMGKAKYKKEVSADKTQKSDSLRMVLRDRIVEDFEKRLK